MKIKNPNDEYLSKHFSSLIKKYGGKWIVIVNGKKFAIVPRTRVRKTIEEARKKFPGSIPMLSPIPTTKQLQCILNLHKF